MRSIVFMASLFVAGLCALVVGGIDVYRLMQFHSSSTHARMELAENAALLQRTLEQGDWQRVAVKYVQNDGAAIAVNRFVPTSVAQQLISGARIPITYITGEPERIFYAGEEPESPWLWLIVGVVCMATFAYALRLIRKHDRTSSMLD
jgi:hypothetical protein